MIIIEEWGNGGIHFLLMKKELVKESVKKNKWKIFYGLSSFRLLFIIIWKYFNHWKEQATIIGENFSLFYQNWNMTHVCKNLKIICWEDVWNLTTKEVVIKLFI